MNSNVIRLVLVAAALAAATGCVHTRRPPLAPEVRSQLGRIGVAVEPSGGGMDDWTPPTGWVSGTAVGFARGVILIPALTLIGAGGGASGGGVGAVFGGALGAALGLVCLPVSIIGGGATAESREATARAVRQLEGACKSARPESVVRESLEGLYRAKTGKTLAPVGPGVQPISLDTLLVARVEVQLRSLESIFSTPWSVNLERQLVVVLQTRLIRLKDQRVLDERSFEWVSKQKPRTFVDWSRNATSLTHEVTLAVGALANDALDDLFVLTAPSPAAPAPKERKTLR